MKTVAGIILSICMLVVLGVAIYTGAWNLYRLWHGTAGIQQPQPDPNEVTVHIWTDPQTHCQYLVLEAHTNLTPRLGIDGFPMCGGLPETTSNAYINL